MKKLWLLLFVLVLPIFALGQYTQSGTISTANAACDPINSCIAIVLNPVDPHGGTSTLTVTIPATSVYTGTLQFEASADKQITWVNLPGIKTDGTGASSSTSGTGVWTFSVAAFTNFRVRASVLSSGTPSVTLQASTSNVVTTAGQNLFPASVSGTYYVDGTTYATPNAVIASLPVSSNGANINWSPASGATVTSVTPFFINTATPGAISVSVGAPPTGQSCSGVLAFLTNGPNEQVSVVVQYSDLFVNAVNTVTVSAAVPNSGSNCYAVTMPASIFATKSASLYMLQCAGSGASPCVGTYTLQAVKSTHATTFTPSSQTLVFDASTAATANCNSTFGFNCGAQLTPANMGLLPRQVNLNLGPGTFITCFVNVAGRSILHMSGRATTVIQQDAGCPNGIPTFMPRGVLDTTGGALTTGQAVEVALGLLEGAPGAQNVVTVSAPIVSPGTPRVCTASCQFQLRNPAPPVMFGQWTASRQRYVGERIFDPTAHSIYRVTTAGTTGTVQPTFSVTCPATTNTCTDGTVTWTNFQAISLWAATTTYGNGVGPDEIWDGTELEMVQASCTSGNATPTWSQNRTIGQVVADSAGGGTCNWQNIGQNNVVLAPRWQFYSSAAFTPTQSAQLTTLTTLQLVGSASSTFAGCSGGKNSGEPTANCTVSDGGAALVATGVTNISAQGAGAALPIASTMSDIACPVTDTSVCTNTNALKYFGAIAWATPDGPIPIMGQSNVTMGSANHAIQFSAPSNPPPNAVGFMVYLGAGLGSSGGACSANPDCALNLQVIDGTNTTCSAYVAGLPFGTLCALGATAVVLSPTPGPSITGISTPNPQMNASDIFTMVGGQWGTQGQNANGQYSSRIENGTIECGRVLNQIEYEGIGLGNFEAEEETGGFDLNINDCAQAGIYIFSNGAQNSSMARNHMAGQNWDYTIGVRIEAVAAFRGLQDFSLNGPAQGTQWASIAGLSLMQPPAFTTGRNQPYILGVQSEASYEAVNVSNTSAFIVNVGTTATAGRQNLNVVHIGGFAPGVFVFGMRGGGSGNCLVQNDVQNATACDISNGNNPAGMYMMGDNSGNGGIGAWLLNPNPAAAGRDAMLLPGIISGQGSVVNQSGDATICTGAACNGTLIATGVTISLPAVARTWQFSCAGQFTSSTTTTPVSWGFGANPGVTAWNATGWEETTGITAIVTGEAGPINNTTVTAVIPATAITPTTATPFHLEGTIRAGNNGTVFTLYGTASGGVTTLVLKDGSSCNFY